MYPASVEYLNRQRIIPNWGGRLWDQRYIYFFPFSLFVSVYVYASVCDFCLYSSACTTCPRVLSVCFFFFSIVLRAYNHWWICFWVWLLSSFFLSLFLLLFNFLIFNNYIYFFILITFLFYSFFLSFFLPFILSRVDDSVLMLRPGVRPVPLRRESWVQDISPPETSQLHVISNGKNLPEIPISTPRTSSTKRPASYSAGHPMPNN